MLPISFDKIYIFEATRKNFSLIFQRILFEIGRMYVKSNFGTCKPYAYNSF